MGMFWWIDRWRNSTAYTEMTLEQQGAYRNLLDEAWKRGGGIPNDPRLLARASGDEIRWPKIEAVVMKRFKLSTDGRTWHNETLDAMLHQTRRYAAKQQAYRDRQSVTQPVTQPVTDTVTKAVTRR